MKGSYQAFLNLAHWKKSDEKKAKQLGLPVRRPCFNAGERKGIQNIPTLNHTGLKRVLSWIIQASDLNTFPRHVLVLTPSSCLALPCLVLSCLVLSCLVCHCIIYKKSFCFTRSGLWKKRPGCQCDILKFSWRGRKLYVYTATCICIDF